MSRSAGKFLLFTIIFAAAAVSAFAQISASPTPRQENLLNGLKLYIFSSSPAKLVTVKIRVHNGSSFDPQDKEGVMKLLAESIFSTDTARNYFEEEFGGGLTIESNYDYIELTAISTPDKFLSMLQLLADSITAPDTEKETVARLKAALLEEIAKRDNDPVYKADRAIAEALYGSFPYGRAQIGTKESLAKLDWADLILAKERLFSADNATVAISGGGIKSDLVMRAARRYFGAWLKADKKFPSTFKNPEEPQDGMPVFDSPVENTSEFRMAVRGSARSDSDYLASRVAARILDKRFKEKEGDKAFVKEEANFLPGSLIFGIHDFYLGQIRKSEGNMLTLPEISYKTDLLKPKITDAEFATAKSEFLTEFTDRDPLEAWLDVDTYKLQPIKDELAAANSLSLADVQNYFDKLKTRPFAEVLVFGNAASQTKSEAAPNN